MRNCCNELDWVGQCLADAERDLSGKRRMWPRADRSQDIPDSTAIETRRHRNRRRANDGIVDDPSRSLLYRWVVSGRWKLIAPANPSAEAEQV